MEALRQKGPVRYLVNNAGFGVMGDFDRTSIDEHRAMVSLHIDASITLCRAAIPYMRELGGGAIINVSSLGSLVVGKGISVYGATKAFLNYYSMALHAELEETGIDVQALCPGFTRTEFHEAMVTESFDGDRIPPKAWMSPEAVVADSLAALGSGQVLVVPGEHNQQIARWGQQQLLDSF
jgi:short-subunit dehydrogenase